MSCFTIMTIVKPWSCWVCNVVFLLPTINTSKLYSLGRNYEGNSSYHHRFWMSTQARGKCVMDNSEGYKFRSQQNYQMSSETMSFGWHEFQHVALFTTILMMVTRVTFIIPPQWYCLILELSKTRSGSRAKRIQTNSALHSWVPEKLVLVIFIYIQRYGNLHMYWSEIRASDTHPILLFQLASRADRIRVKGKSEKLFFWLI